MQAQGGQGVMNNYKIEIYQDGAWVQYRAEFPIKFANLLNEQLDEAEIRLKRVAVQYFKPLTKVRITLINTPPAKFTEADFDRIQARAETNVTYTYNSDKTITETKEFLFVVASDNATEICAGSRKYDHSLYLIESTKILEGFICDSITFTNALGQNYTDS